MTIPPNYDWLLNEPGPVWTRELLKEYGTEFAPRDLNPVVEAWEKELGVTIHGYFAWCGLTQGIMMKRAGVEPPAIAVRALAWASWGTTAIQPDFGDILVFTWLSGSDRGGSHVTQYIGEDAECYHCLGGNQSHCVDIARFPKADLHAARHAPGLTINYGLRILNPNGSRI